jgi:hypothetical protein
MRPWQTWRATPSENTGRCCVPCCHYIRQSQWLTLGMDRIHVSGDWYDAWHNEDALADRFPSLQSLHESVAQAIEMGVDSSNFLVPRLSPQASNELAQLREITSLVSFSDNRDMHRGPFCIGTGKLDFGGLYCLLQSRTAQPHPAAKFIWGSRAPPR